MEPALEQTQAVAKIHTRPVQVVVPADVGESISEFEGIRNAVAAELAGSRWNLGRIGDRLLGKRRGAEEQERDAVLSHRRNFGSAFEPWIRE